MGKAIKKGDNNQQFLSEINKSNKKLSYIIFKISIKTY